MCISQARTCFHQATAQNTSGPLPSVLSGRCRRRWARAHYQPRRDLETVPGFRRGTAAAPSAAGGLQNDSPLGVQAGGISLHVLVDPPPRSAAKPLLTTLRANTSTPGDRDLSAVTRRTRSASVPPDIWDLPSALPRGALVTTRSDKGLPGGTGSFGKTDSSLPAANPKTGAARSKAAPFRFLQGHKAPAHLFESAPTDRASPPRPPPPQAAAVRH